MVNGIKVIVVTGGPGSGKDSLIAAITSDSEIGEFVLVETEAAAWVIAGQNMTRQDFAASEAVRITFQQVVAATQRLKVLLAVERARRTGKTTVIFNRFAFGGAAYLTGGLDEFWQITGMDPLCSNEVDAVIWTAPPPPEHYVCHDPSDPNGYRFEDYQTAVELGARVLNAYTGLGLAVHEVAGQDNFADKRQAFILLIRRLI